MLPPPDGIQMQSTAEIMGIIPSPIHVLQPVHRRTNEHACLSTGAQLRRAPTALML